MHTALSLNLRQWSSIGVVTHSLTDCGQCCVPCCIQDELRRLEAERREAERNRHKDEREREKELELIRKQYLVSDMVVNVRGEGREVIRLAHFQGGSAQGQAPYLLLTPYTHGVPMTLLSTCCKLSHAELAKRLHSQGLAQPCKIRSRCHSRSSSDWFLSKACSCQHGTLIAASQCLGGCSGCRCMHRHGNRSTGLGVDYLCALCGTAC